MPLAAATKLLFVSGESDTRHLGRQLMCRIKPTSSPFSNTAYEVSQTSLTLSDAHPNVVKRGGKAGREDEYTYTFGQLVCWSGASADQ